MHTIKFILESNVAVCSKSKSSCVHFRNDLHQNCLNYYNEKNLPMRISHNQIDRRTFFKTTGMLSASIASLPFVASTPSEEQKYNPLPAEGMNVLGPREGYTPHVGTLVSMMAWMRMVILMPVNNLTTEQLDYLHDDNSNSIGAMLLHLAATERFYYLHTVEGKKWGDWPKKDDQRFSAAMELGKIGRQSIKGNPLDFYLSTLHEVRENTLAAFRKRDDEWLMDVDKEWGWGPTNNYCKWFHVCEHESNHNGQIKWIKSRLPGAKPGND
jgi:hypothetical protein